MGVLLTFQGLKYFLHVFVTYEEGSSTFSVGKGGKCYLYSTVT